MGVKQKSFIVYEKVFEGTTNECREFLGVSDSSVRDAVNDGRLVAGRYILEEILDADAKQKREAVASWDAFTEPLRQKYGIPRYRAKPEVSE
jgi:hypothetical protein